MGLFGKLAQTTGAKAVAGMTRYSSKGLAGVAGALQLAADHPVLTTMGLLGAGSVLSYGTSAQQAVPTGPYTVNPVPNSSQSSSNFDLGASGDLVFALHRLNH